MHAEAFTRETPDAAAPGADAAPQPNRRFISLIYAAMSLAVIALGALAFERVTAFEHHAAEQRLSDILALKVAQVENWWAERQANARSLRGSLELSRTAIAWIASPTEESRAVILDRMESLRTAYGFTEIMLFDGTARLRLSTTGADAGERHHDDEVELARRAISTGEIAYSNFHRPGERADGEMGIEIDIAVPYPGPTVDTGAVLLLSIDTRRILLPLIDIWPLSNRSAEIVFGQRDGDHVVIVNPQRDLAGGTVSDPLSVRLPLSRRDLPIAAAINGHTGIIIGQDYKGIDVLAAVRPIPNTPWAMVAKVEQREIAGTVYTIAGAVGGMTMLVLVGGGILINWRVRRQEADFYRHGFLAEREHRLALERSRAAYERTAAALTESEERYRSLFVNARVAELIIDPSDGAIVDANAAAAAYYGHAPERLRAMNISDINTLSRVEIAEEMARARAQQRSHFHFRHRLASGVVRDVEVHSGPLKVGGRRLLYSIVHDITDRKQTEAALHASENNYHTLVRLSPAGIVRIDADGSIVYVSRRWCEQAGLSVEALRAHGWESAVHPDDRDALLRTWSEALARGTEFHAEFRFRHRDGKSLWVAMAAVPERDEDGTVVGFVAATTDITRTKVLEEELKTSNRDLEQFAYVASHDLREPLRTMASFIGLLERHHAGKLDQDGLEFIGFVKDGARRMDGMITGLLEYSRIGRKGAPLLPAAIGPVVAQAVSSLGVAIEECGARVSVAGDMPVVRIDETEIARLFQNLIGNAIKYQPPGAVPEVRVSAVRDGGDWVFSVADNGIGIADKNFERIFGIFQRLHGVGEYEGSGIGLAVCRKIVERHGGRIWVDSASGAGSTFHFTLPVHEPAPVGEAI